MKRISLSIAVAFTLLFGVPNASLADEHQSRGLMNQSQAIKIAFAVQTARELKFIPQFESIIDNPKIDDLTYNADAACGTVDAHGSLVYVPAFAWNFRDLDELGDGQFMGTLIADHPSSPPLVGVFAMHVRRDGEHFIAEYVDTSNTVAAVSRVSALQTDPIKFDGFEHPTFAITSGITPLTIGMYACEEQYAVCRIALLIEHPYEVGKLPDWDIKQ